VAALGFVCPTLSTVCAAGSRDVLVTQKLLDGIIDDISKGEGKTVMGAGLHDVLLKWVWALEPGELPRTRTRHACSWHTTHKTNIFSNAMRLVAGMSTNDLPARAGVSKLFRWAVGADSPLNMYATIRGALGELEGQAGASLALAQRALANGTWSLVHEYFAG